MKKSAKRWLIGSGVVVAGAAAVGVASRAISKYLVKLAMDREGPKRVEKGITMVSGSPENAELIAKATEAMQALENAGCETVEIQSHDGIRLVGHWYPAQQPKRIIVAMHGWRSSWSRDFGMIADFWHDSGCSVLYAEQRGQGESGGDYMGFGMLERYDCLDWTRWVNERCGTDAPVYLAGLSMGATTVLMAAGLEFPENVRGIMADCGFTSAHDIWKHVTESNLHLPYGMYASAANDLCKKKINLGTKDYSAVDAMHECKVPVLFIHGTDDKFVPVEMTFENYKACTAPKRLFVVPGADHALSYCKDKAGYESEVTNFWNLCDE